MKGSEPIDLDAVDVDPLQKRIIEHRAQRRLYLREKFLKEMSNPFNYGGGESTIFDPAIQRYHAMQVSMYDYFKPTFKNLMGGIFLVVVPMLTYGYFVHKSRTEREILLRGGSIPYKDRTHKFQ